MASPNHTIMTPVPPNHTDTIMLLMKSMMETRHEVYLIAVPSIMFLCVVALFTNGLVLLAYARLGSTKWTPSLRLALGLVVADMWTSLLVAAGLFVNAYLPTAYNVDISICVTLSMEIPRMSGFLTTTAHLMCLSVNHYVSIAHPFRYRTIFTPSNTYMMMLAMWIVPLAGYIIMTTTQPGKNYLTEGGECNNLEDFMALRYRMIISSLIVGMACIMVVIYIAVSVRLRNMSKRFNQGNNRSKSQASQLSRERRMLVTSCWICGTFFVGWLPASLQFALTCGDCVLGSAMAGPQSMTKFILILFTGIVAITCIIVKSIINPIVYAVRIPEIKENMSELMNKFSNCLPRSLQPEQKTSNRPISTMGSTVILAQNGNSARCRSMVPSTMAKPSMMPPPPYNVEGDRQQPPPTKPPPIPVEEHLEPLIDATIDEATVEEVRDMCVSDDDVLMHTGGEGDARRSSGSREAINLLDSNSFLSWMDNQEDISDL